MQQTSGSGERYPSQSCSMHVHTDGRLLFFLTTPAGRSQGDRISPETLLGGLQAATWASFEHKKTRSSCNGELTSFRLQHQLVRSKTQTGLLSNSEEYFRGVADHFHGALTEMRATSGGLHTVRSIFHCSCARAAQESSEFP